MYKYHAEYKPNQLTTGTGQTSIVTGWTPKELITKHLDPANFASVGQLYSPVRGISFLLRNLLLNPHVRYLVILNATREDTTAGGCQCLLDFFNHGCQEGVSDIGKGCWVINSPIPGFIDKEIPLEALELLRSAIAVQEAKTISEAIALTHSSQFYTTDPWGTPLKFPLLETTPVIMPGELYGHRIEGRTIAETWVKIIHRIKTTGTIRPTHYDGKWQELINLMAIITEEPKDFYFPEPNYLPVDRTAINNYLPQMLADAPYQEGVKYTYGQRMRSWFGVDQIEEVSNKLAKDIDSASAVINLWDSGTGNNLAGSLTPNQICSGIVERFKQKTPINISGFTTRYDRSPLSSDHQYDSPPCLNHIWLRVVDGKLSMTATFRSNDMFSAWVSNVMGLRALQWHILESVVDRANITLEIAPLIIISQSAHIYDDCWESADRLIATQYHRLNQRQDYSDPAGNFIIEVNKIIQITQTNPAGETVAIYEGDRPLKLIRQICHKNPAIKPDHIGYLGIELERALGCLVSGRSYQQDRHCNN